MANCKLEEDSLLVREELNHKTALKLTRLRLVYLVASTSSRWYVVTSSQGMVFIDLDGIGEDKSSEVEGMLTELLKQRGSTGCSLALADYKGNSAFFPLEALRSGASNFSEILGSSRAARLELRERWLAGSPRVELKSNFGVTATLTPAGFECRNRFISWSDVGGIHVETTNGIRTDLLVLRHGRRGGIFDFKRFENSLPFVPGKRKEVYQAECHFWLSRHAESRGRTLGQLAQSHQESRSGAS